MTVDVFDKKTGKFLGTKYDVNYIQEGALYYFLRDEEGQESRYNKNFHKLIIHTGKGDVPLSAFSSELVYHVL